MKKATIKIKLLAAMLTLSMVLLLMPVRVFATNPTAGSVTVGNEAELKAALENENCTEIKLGGSIETSDRIEVTHTVTLDLNGHTISSSSYRDDIFRVTSNGNMTVKDSAGGGKIDGQDRYSAFSVKGGVLTLESGSIVNCNTVDGDGGAVDVSNTGISEAIVKYGKFVMNGGNILNCKAGDDGAAVDIGNGCTFTMNGGTIKDCRADDDGGAVFIKQGGFFVLNDGTIEKCSAGCNGGAVNIYGDGSFTMTGGTIKSCQVDLGGLGMAVYGTDDAVVTMTGGTFEDCGAYPYSFNELTVTFDSDGGSAVADQKILNSSAIKPENPSKDGYDFAGWYLGEDEYQFDSNVTGNITLKAHWTPASTSVAITTAAIENVKFDYQPDEAPKATAWVSESDADKYEIVYECWQQFENNQPVAAWYSDNSSQGSLPVITKFESGKSYVYSIMLKPKDGYSFTGETTVTINGENVSSPFTGGVMYIPAVKTINILTVETIDVVEINDATISFKDGDKPVFTGKVPDDAKYAYRCEWWELDSKTGAMSTDFGNFYENKITAFEAGKTYHYGVYVTTYGDVGNVRYIFGPDTKLKINGKFVDYKRYDGDTGNGSDGTMWVITDLTVTPQAPAATVDKPDKDVTESPNTGDNSNLMLLVTLLLASGGVMLGVMAADKRKKYFVK